MGVLGMFSGPAKTVGADVKQSSPEPDPATASSTLPSEADPAPPSKPESSIAPEVPVEAKAEEPPKKPARRLSFRPFNNPSPKPKQHKPILSEAQEHEKKASAANAFSKRWAKPLSSNSDKRAKESALIVRTLIVGHSSNDFSAPTLTKAVATPQLSKVKSELMQPNSANKVIAQLRALPVMESPAEEGGEDVRARAHSCHAHAESSTFVPNVGAAPLDKLTGMFAEMHIVDLIADDFEAVLSGIEQLTPQLMALGYATGKAFLPDHKGIHPPMDRISVLTYWWGLEIVLPEPTMQYLSNTQSIAGTLVNFLTALSVMNNGVREILPFVRYISQFIDFEFKTIKSQDRGKGVVCAATWIMPAALVPRAWDFPPPEQAPAIMAVEKVKEVTSGNTEVLELEVTTVSIPNPAASAPLPSSPSPPAPDAVTSGPATSPSADAPTGPPTSPSTDASAPPPLV
ncbi:Lactamase-B domain-containing protein [Mycena sanguinolenta]|uniref:Lactamase-B domain-containing protein n=1 Tax=Mycena sanguinolenta TaxID=230812 RepID=A0A8H6ZEC8_9AGAR|nr:Lactamase-B domain-containing protein [Mycena sanguinolenta]